MGRKKSREEVFKLLYQIDIRKEPCDQVVEFYLQSEPEFFEDYKLVPVLSQNDRDYISSVACGVYDNIESIDETIRANLHDWAFDRISKVSLAIIRLALYEIIYRQDIPASVSINEAVELAKRFDDAKNSAFVNGLLGNIQ